MVDGMKDRWVDRMHRLPMTADEFATAIADLVRARTEQLEEQVDELVRELQYIVDSKGFTQLSHAKQEHVRRAIKTRGIRDR